MDGCTKEKKEYKKKYEDLYEKYPKFMKKLEEDPYSEELEVLICMKKKGLKSKNEEEYKKVDMEVEEYVRNKHSPWMNKFLKKD